jgi:diaminohydroxyphosphoribosylaminopyrimidine deaminase/5-amino-6-(5-phosphoribosylamino)uracil reductase
MVGAVIVRAGRVIGLGHHRRIGGPHAERDAIESCKRRGEDPRGSTMYVTLEPCNAHGRQPPCVPAIIDAGIARVVYARPDPGGPKSGGAAALRRGGVDSVPCACSPWALRLGAPFARRATTGMPWVIAKWAQSLDGGLATAEGTSKWISGEESRRRVHRMRARVDAVLTGIGTILADDPLLTARGVHRVRRVARRVVVDPDLRTPASSRLVRSAGEAPVTICCARPRADAAASRLALERAGVEVVEAPGERGLVDLRACLAHLAGAHGATNVMVEAGPRLLGALMGAGLVDECVVFIAPMLLGAGKRAIETGDPLRALADAPRMSLVRARRTGEDLEMILLRRGDEAAAITSGATTPDPAGPAA